MGTFLFILALMMAAAAIIAAFLAPNLLREAGQWGQLTLTRVRLLLGGILAEVVTNLLFWACWVMGGLFLLMATAFLFQAVNSTLELQAWLMGGVVALVAALSIIRFWVLRDQQLAAVPQYLDGEFPPYLTDDTGNVLSVNGGAAQVITFVNGQPVTHHITLDDQHNLVIGNGAVVIQNGGLFTPNPQNPANFDQVLENGIHLTEAELRTRLEGHPLAGQRLFDEDALHPAASRPIHSVFTLFFAFFALGWLGLWLGALAESRIIVLLSLTSAVLAIGPVLACVGLLRLIVPHGRMERALDPFLASPWLLVRNILSVYAIVLAWPSALVASVATIVIATAMITYAIHYTSDRVEVREWMRKASRKLALIAPPLAGIGVVLEFWNPLGNSYIAATLKQGHGHLLWSALYWTGNETLLVNQGEQELVLLTLWIVAGVIAFFWFGKKLKPAEGGWIRKLPYRVCYAVGAFGILQLVPVYFEGVALFDGKNQYKMTNNMALVDQSFEEAAAAATKANKKLIVELEKKKEAKEAAKQQKKEKSAYASSSYPSLGTTTNVPAIPNNPPSQGARTRKIGERTPLFQQVMEERERTAVAHADAP